MIKVKKTSLQEIIEIVLKENNRDVDESLVRSLRRAFDKLFEKLGGDKKVLKDGGKTIEFDELDVPVIKVLISELYSGKGIISEFVNARNVNKKFSSSEVNDFLRALNKEIEEKELLNKEEMQDLEVFFRNIFLYSPLRSLENCHSMIDALASQLHDLDCDEQSLYLGKVEHILKKEFALRIAESAQEIVRIAERKEYSGKFYYEQDPEIQFYYAERDRHILEAIQEDNDLRQYVEKKLGRKSEEIFNYAPLAGK